MRNNSQLATLLAKQVQTIINKLLNSPQITYYGLDFSVYRNNQQKYVNLFFKLILIYEYNIITSLH